jgi:hypothetical protein
MTTTPVPRSAPPKEVVFAKEDLLKEAKPIKVKVKNDL